MNNNEAKKRLMFYDFSFLTIGMLVVLYAAYIFFILSNDTLNFLEIASSIIVYFLILLSLMLRVSLSIEAFYRKNYVWGITILVFGFLVLLIYYFVELRSELKDALGRAEGK